MILTGLTPLEQASEVDTQLKKWISDYWFLIQTDIEHIEMGERYNRYIRRNDKHSTVDNRYGGNR